MMLRRAAVPYAPEIVFEMHDDPSPAEPYRIELVNQADGSRIRLTAAQWNELVTAAPTLRARAR